MGDEPRYWAFISYSHADRKIGQWLHGALERYLVPRSLVGRPTPAGPAPRRFRPIFRDREELGANADLAAHINQALDASAYLIVVCSPAAARSRWVEQEIERFKAHHDEDRVLAIVVDGEPFATGLAGREAEECFPRGLRFRLGPDGQAIGPAEPVAADLRPHGDGRRHGRLKLLAGMLGVSLDALARRDEQRRRRVLVGAVAASSAISVAMTGLSLAAVRARNEAHRQRDEAEGLIEFMVGDLRKKLEPAGRLDVLDAVGAHAMAYYSAQPDSGLGADSLGRRARVLHMVGDLREKRGDIAGAFKVFQAAAATTQTLLDREPNNPQRVFDHAQSVYWVGWMAFRRDDRETAQRQFQTYKVLADRLIGFDPRKPEWLAEGGYANTNLGTVLLQRGDAAGARAAFAEAVKVKAQLAARAPDDVGRQLDLGNSYAWLADSETFLAPEAALADRLAERRIYERLLARAPNNRMAARSLIVNRGAVAKLHIAAGDAAAGKAELARAAHEGEALIAGEPNDLHFRTAVTTIYNLIARADLNTGDLGSAQAAAARALALAEGLVAKDPTMVSWQGAALGEARLLQVEIAAEAAHGTDAVRAALAPASGEADRLERLAAATPQDMRLAPLAVEAAILRGDLYAFSNQPELAASEWRRGLARLAQLRPSPTAAERNIALKAAAAQRLAALTRASRSPGGAAAPTAEVANAQFPQLKWGRLGSGPAAGGT